MAEKQGNCLFDCLELWQVQLKSTKHSNHFQLQLVVVAWAGFTRSLLLLQTGLWGHEKEWRKPALKHPETCKVPKMPRFVFSRTVCIVCQTAGFSYRSSCDNHGWAYARQSWRQDAGRAKLGSSLRWTNSSTWWTPVMPPKPEPKFLQVSPSCPGTDREGSCRVGQIEMRTAVEFSPLIHSLSWTCHQCNTISMVPSSGTCIIGWEAPDWIQDLGHDVHAFWWRRKGFCSAGSWHLTRGWHQDLRARRQLMCIRWTSQCTHSPCKALRCLHLLHAQYPMTRERELWVQLSINAVSH